MTKIIAFINNEDDAEPTNHFFYRNSGYSTLCGADSEHADTEYEEDIEHVNGKITCKQCIALITAVKRARLQKGRDY